MDIQQKHWKGFSFGHNFRLRNGTPFIKLGESFLQSVLFVNRPLLNKFTPPGIFLIFVARRNVKQHSAGTSDL